MASWYVEITPDMKQRCEKFLAKNLQEVIMSARFDSLPCSKFVMLQLQLPNVGTMEQISTSIGADDPRRIRNMAAKHHAWRQDQSR
jgi:hypothetical protein